MPRGIYKRTQEFIDKYLSHCKRVGLANNCKTNYNREDWTNYFFKKGF